jgi:hypothetical protein
MGDADQRFGQAKPVGMAGGGLRQTLKPLKRPQGKFIAT